MSNLWSFKYFNSFCHGSQISFFSLNASANNGLKVEQLGSSECQASVAKGHMAHHRTWQSAPFHSHFTYNCYKDCGFWRQQANTKSQHNKLSSILKKMWEHIWYCFPGFANSQRLIFLCHIIYNYYYICKYQKLP